MQQAERAIFDLRRGQPVRITDGECDVLTLAVESLTEESLARLRGMCNGAPALVITANRARTLDLDPGDAPAVRLALREDAATADIHALATAVCSDPADHSLHPTTVPAARAEYAATHMARAGKLLPAVITIRARGTDATGLDRLESDGTILHVTADEALTVPTTPWLDPVHVSDARVPLADADNTRFLLFREANGLHEHVAVVIGERGQWPDPVPIRMHSACLTGDLFGSLRCDCGEQLRNSVRTIDAAGGGVLLYLAQEGRGIGLANKLRAYNLQDAGMDTLEANCSLGFGADERHYDAAVAMLRHVGVERVSLLTNNPLKIGALEEGGITVADRQPLHGSLNPHNVRYLNTKAERSGHWLDELFARALPDE
ncbi:GTP cyclohydrolase II RibA [Aquisalimonas lutea]|uniref:GTP cyclohydrolase II RibA n=1 Tax=Aquisalimonas lutea TaxID=1327750 RepID=UPI0025B56A8E|nr:GTP cyclohydrolase II RibA [Aquisalimonas lutea]MDN3516213.1 GTP cyclohydrolase II RibA [Aquisalimonas lutea]